MPDLSFRVEGVEPQRGALAPHLLFRLRVTEPTDTPIHTAVLRCQVHVEPARRRYGAAEQGRLLDLFGTPDRWGETLRHLVWAQVDAVLPAFRGDASFDLPVPCSYDFTLAVTRYIDALEGGEVPLGFLFSGTVFYQAASGGLQVAPVSWAKEAAFRLPAAVWKELMERYYPDGVWLRLDRSLFDRLSRYRSRRGLPTWEQALEGLLAGAEETP